MQVALAELIPEHRHAPAGQCDTGYSDWHQLRMAEYTCPNALQRFYQINSVASDNKATAWAHTEQALATADANEAMRLFGAAQAAILEGMRLKRRQNDGGIGLSLLGRSIPLMRERVARHLDGDSFDPESIGRHAADMAVIGHAAFDKLVNIPGLDARIERALLQKGATAIICSLINRQKDPEFVAMPASVREERSARRHDISVGHGVAVIGPTGKWALTRSVQTGIEPITTVFGKAFCDQVVSLHKSQPVFDTKLKRGGDIFYYVSSMLEHEVSGSRDFDERQAQHLQTLGSWLVDTTKAGVLFEQGDRA